MGGSGLRPMCGSGLWPMCGSGLWPRWMRDRFPLSRPAGRSHPHAHFHSQARLHTQCVGAAYGRDGCGICFPFRGLQAAPTGEFAPPASSPPRSLCGSGLRPRWMRDLFPLSRPAGRSHRRVRPHPPARSHGQCVGAAYGRDGCGIVSSFRGLQAAPTNEFAPTRKLAPTPNMWERPTAAMDAGSAPAFAAFSPLPHPSSLPPARLPPPASSPSVPSRLPVFGSDA